ncbi:TPA: RHS repeat protein [Salmonella enterica]|nr:RHS repeat protein [Salmonella enterica]
MNQHFYTQTSNFTSHGIADVDIRTRAFGFNCTLATLKGNKGLGPELEMSLGYNNSDNSNVWALGIGFSYNLTVYDKTNGNLILESGESYQVNDSGTQPVLLQQKIPSIIFEKKGTYEYQVVDKNGNITQLKDQLQNGIFLPVKITSALGHSLTLKWKNSNSGFVLSSVIDDSNTVLCSLNYPSGSGTTEIIIYPETAEEFTVTLYTTNHYLTKITHSQLGHSFPWSLGYQDVGMGDSLQTLVQVKTPTGLEKNVIYNYGQKKGLLHFPDSAKLDPLPAVTQLTVSPGHGQPDMVTHYFATENNNDSANIFKNYLGYDYHLGSNWSPNSDFMYSQFDPDYSYQTIVSQPAVDGNSELRTVYTYNNYHLQTSVKTTEGDTTHLVEVKYYIDDYPYKSFNELPAQFQSPKIQTETWINGAKESSVQRTGFEYDSFGNLTRQISLCDANGNATEQSTIIASVYYAAQGEKDSADGYTGCPADPWGFTHWLKSKTTTPPILHGYDDVPVRTQLYRYQSSQVLDDMPVSYAVIPSTKTLTSSDITGSKMRILLRQQSDYVTDKKSVDFGRKKQQTLSIFDDSGTRYTKTHDFAWAYANASTTCAETLTTYDNLKASTTIIVSDYTGRIQSQTDRLNNTQNHYYDTMGRITQTVYSPNTKYESIKKFTYYLINDKDNTTPEISSEITDINTGKTDKYIFDSAGRVISHSTNAADFDRPDDLLEIKEIQWDARGRKHSEIEKDYSQDKDNKLKTYSVTTQYHYDNWGQNDSTSLSYGRQDINAHDPVHRCDISQTVSTNGALHLSSTKIEYDLQGNAIKQITCDKNGADYATTLSEYDGLGRLRQFTDALGYITQCTWDDFDRMQSKRLANGALLEWTYVSYSPENLPTTISLNGVQAGSQDYDGLGRLTATFCGGRADRATYTGASHTPDTTTDAMDQTINHTWIPELHSVPSSITGTDFEQSFTYNDVTGALLTSSESQSRTTQFQCYASGLAKSEQITDNARAMVEMDHGWTLMGQPVTYTDISGNVVTIDYDDYGRYSTTTDAEVIASVLYDDVGRLYYQKSTSATEEVVIELELDDYSREHIRTITPSSGEAITITQEYYANNQLKNRYTSVGLNVVRTETFEYDECNRLQHYYCEGSSPVVDAYNHSISQQDFTFDDYNNITCCVTTLADGLKDTANYEFTNQNDPCQLITVTHSLTSHYPAQYTLEYDDNGRMVKDEAGRTLSYDTAGRLIHIEVNNTESHYKYDSSNKLIMQTLDQDNSTAIYYLEDKIISEVNTNSNKHTRQIPGAMGIFSVNDDAK